MTTVAEWVNDTRYHLNGDLSEQANVLANPYTAGSASLVFTYDLGPIAAGSILSIGANTFRVIAINEGTKTATVIPGYQGSIDANAASGAMVLVNPRFTDHRILRALSDELRSLSSPRNGLYQVASTTLDYAGAVEGYDLTGVSGLIRVLEVRRQVHGPSLAWPAVESTWWDVLRSAPTEFATGVSLRVRGVDAGLQVQVVYAKEFTPTMTITDNVSVTGVPSTAEDIPPLGAAVRLMSGREVARNQLAAQGDSRRANEVPPGAVGASWRGLAALHAERVGEESARLRAQFPVGK